MPRQTKQWKPKEGELFWSIDIMNACDFKDLYVESWVYHTHEDMAGTQDMVKEGNCFRTRKEAESAKKRVLKALKP